jgi:hypothetical protein
MLCNTIFSSGSTTVGTRLLSSSRRILAMVYTIPSKEDRPHLSACIITFSTISYDQNAYFQFFLEPERFTSRLCTLRRSPSAHHTFLSRLFQQGCVWLEFPARGQVWKPYRWVLCPIPSLTLEEVFPPTSLTVIHFWVRGLFWS